MQAPLLEISKLTVRYQPETAAPVLSNLDFRLAAGEAAGIFGASGCGKTTFARAISLLLPPRTQVGGTVRFAGVDLVALDAPELRHIRGARLATLLQEPSVSLTPHLRIGTQVAEVIRAHRPMNSEQANYEALGVLGSVFGEEAGKVACSYPHELSGGERQKAAIARAVCCQPKLLVADEPTAALDSVARRDVLKLLRFLTGRAGMALLLISHDRRVLDEATTRQMELREGRLEPL